MNRFLWPLLGLVVAAGVAWAVFLRKDAQDNAMDSRELATRVMAEYLAEKYPQHQAVVISNPFTHEGKVAKEIVEMERSGIEGVKEGLGTRATLEAVVYPELKPEAKANPRAVFIDGATSTPLSFLIAEDAFDKIMAKYPQCDILISLVGLPAALNQVKCWTDSEKPRFALLLPDLRFVGDAAAVQRAVKTGKLAAFVLNKPGAPDSRAALKGDLRTEFSKRFVLVTAQNIDQVVQQYPQMFGPK